MAKRESLNEEAALNNNLDSSTLKMNREISKAHKNPKAKNNPEKN